MATTDELTPDEIQMVNEHRRQIAEQAEQTPESPGQEPEPTYDPNSVGPRDLVRQVLKDGMDAGARDEDIGGEYIRRAALRAHQGDPRFIWTGAKTTVFGVPVE